MSEAMLYEADEAARRAALDTSRSFIVQAPAGSGKTELLIQRYLKLLALVDSPEEVLAITFTRKAAAEMRNRIVEALEKAGEDDAGLLPHELTTRHAARSVLARDRDQGWQLLRHPRRLRIQTLDSLNATIARMLPVTAAVNVAGNAVADEAQTRSLYRQAAVASLEWVTSGEAFADAIETLLGHLDNNTGLYIDYLADMLGVRDQWLPFIGSGQLSDEEFASLRRNLENDLDSIRREQVENANLHVTPEQRDALVELGRLAAANLIDEGKESHPIVAMSRAVDSVEWWCGATELLLTADGTWRRRLTKTIGLPPNAKAAKARLTDLIEELSRRRGAELVLHGFRDLPPARYDDRQWEVLVALIRLLPLVTAELEALFTRRGITDFVEIARAADNAMGTAESPSDIALLLDYQVRHILVDEMQDTSLAQYGMIRSLTQGWSPEEGRTLFCVGDPMQSIYRFRNAEVAQFLTARREGIGEVSLEELVLRRNFRSGEYLVDWFNAVFPEVLPEEDDPVNSAVSYSDSVAAEHHRGIGSIKVHPSLGTGKEAEADVGFAVIERLLAEHPGDSVAVLVRSRTVLPDLLRRLKVAGIDYEALDIDRLTDLPEAIDVLALTRAAVHPGDRHAWLALLRGPWIGLDWTDLHALVRNDRSSTVWELLNSEERVAALSRAGQEAVAHAMPVLSRLREPRRFDTLRDVVEQAWLALGGAAIPESPDAIDNVYRLLDVIGKLEQAGTLDDVAELEAELDQERIASVRPGTLSVMTMHKAKGLQFDHVVLYGLGRRPRSSTADVLSWMELPPEDGRTRRVMSPVGPRAELEKDPVHGYISTITKRRDTFETGRLLYVACTRARKSLQLVGHADLTADASDVKAPPPSSLLHLLWPFVRDRFCEVLAENGPPAAEVTEVWALPRLRRFSRRWEVPGAPPVPGTFEVVHERGDTVDYDWVGSGARLAGTLVHRWLQRVAEGLAAIDDYAAAESRSLFDRWLNESGAATAIRAEVIGRAHAALAAMADDARGRWLVSGEGYSELSLTGVVEGEVLTGVIDRVRIDAGEHWIVDYKTSSHEGGDLEGFLAAESERYRSQLARYKTLYEGWSRGAARCALYFPLLARWVEVDV